MKSTHENAAEATGGKSLVSPSDFWIQTVAAGIFTITTATHDGEIACIAKPEQPAKQKENKDSPAPLEKSAFTPEDLKLLDDIDVDVKQALHQCSSCTNLLAIPIVLSRLPMNEPVTIAKLRESSNECVTSELYASVDRSLSILEEHPHLAFAACVRAEQQLHALGTMDPRRPLLLQLLSVCRKQMLEKQ